MIIMQEAECALSYPGADSEKDTFNKIQKCFLRMSSYYFNEFLECELESLLIITIY